MRTSKLEDVRVLVKSEKRLWEVSQIRLDGDGRHVDDGLWLRHVFFEQRVRYPRGA